MEELFSIALIKHFYKSLDFLLNNISTPTLYQHLTAVIFKLLIQQHYQVSSDDVWRLLLKIPKKEKYKPQQIRTN